MREGRPVYPYHPFLRMRFTAGLVSMKYTKIELATDRVPRRPNQKDALLTSHYLRLPRSSLPAPSCFALFSFPPAAPFSTIRLSARPLLQRAD